MPELPEVETIARTLAGEVESRLIQAVEVLDESAVEPEAEAFSALVLGRRIARVDRRGKLLLLHLQAGGGKDGGVVAVHLRMTGRVLALPLGENPVRPRVVLTLSDRGGGALQLVFSDVRRFGRMHAFAPGVGPGSIERWPFYQNLGPEPLGMTAGEFRERLAPHGKKSKARLKALLLDQSVLAGIGNIYADEALFRAGIRPDAVAGAVSARRLDRLFAAIQAVLAQAIAENGSSIRDYRDAFGNAGAFQNSFRAYGRAGQPCLECAAPMRSIRVAGRTSTYCQRCQTS
ncbi:MAG: bifunctional DNA-formamidopyrimidine glycosylase/DNA-(apurinic or apyrimidinic site) lyase [Humidesulfovibrio sp.]|uniref:bifunctional DNA-formamidopyrimidine glycosylase/DNA-(apurinic or apyrimidinic site) lyase n=1 Tax=Humidesulfovibrio sp. TaxID=2910988 RepID=UPI0027FD3CA1|nr:bifunctional DNA-formamidopyrimidine glycosylase/DNA-(apurinic or apyrimidinic site) lyase [Humidesulfovibrio sp.]MDQ7836142.1 bifunctional DNA-formamidopyrimidine glycosylase/DNA-(apurinic or apyrimidinic site) lyase [Humidesulfovibrio sp.]